MVTERVRSWCRGVVAAIPFCIYVCKDCSCILGPIQSIPSLGVRSVFLFVVADVVRIVPYESFHPLRHNDVAKKPPPVFKKKKKKKTPLTKGLPGMHTATKMAAESTNALLVRQLIGVEFALLTQGGMAPSLAAAQVRFAYTHYIVPDHTCT